MEIDVVLKAFADMGEKVEANTKALYDYNERLRRGIFRTKQSTVALNSSGYGIMNLGGPPALYIWIVRLIVFSDALAWTNTMGAATVQFGIGQITPEAEAGISPMAPNTVRWPFVTCPNAADFGINHFRMTHGEELYCQIQGGNANQTIQATVNVEEWLVSSLPKAF